MEDGAFHAIVALNSTLQLLQHAKATKPQTRYYKVFNTSTVSNNEKAAFVAEEHDLLNQTAAPCVICWAGMQVLSLAPFMHMSYHATRPSTPTGHVNTSLSKTQPVRSILASVLKPSGHTVVLALSHV